MVCTRVQGSSLFSAVGFTVESYIDRCDKQHQVFNSHDGVVLRKDLDCCASMLP